MDAGDIQNARDVNMISKDFRWGVALAALSIGAPSLANAQDAGVGNQDSQEAAVIDEIVVTGVRLQNQRAVAQKREADRIVDSITADEVGALPDFSLAEALTRVPGVSYEGRNGDAEFVVIRGLRSDFNYLEIDGAIVPSTRTNGRATQLSVIPSYIIRTTDVVKSFTADLDANSIGGQLSVRTLSAFDQDDLYFSARGALGAFDHNEGPHDLDQASRLDFAFANQFGANNQFGIVIGGSYSLQDYGTWLPGVGFNEYRFQTATGSLTDRIENAPEGAIRVPAGVQMYQYINEIERTGIYGKIEWRPTSNLDFALSVYQFEEIDTEERWDTGVYPINPNNLPTNLTRTSGTLAQGVAQRQYFLQGDTNTLQSITLSGSWTPGDRHEVDFLVTQATGERENPFYQVRFEAQGTANQSAFGYSYDSSGVYPVLTLTNPARWDEDARFTPVFYRPQLNRNEQEAFQSLLDYSYNMRGRASGFSFKTGLSFRTDERFQDRVFSNDFRPNTLAAQNISFSNVRLENTTGFVPELLSGLPQILIDERAFLDYFNGSSNQWRDATDPFVLAANADFTVEEEISAGYVMARYAFDTFTVTGGLRHETTNLISTGARRLVDTNPATPEYPIVTEAASYSEWLPSFSVTADAMENLRVRAAYSRTLGRGEYSQLNVNGSQTIDTAQRTISITSGNPALAPRVSDNYDLSFEYYMPSLDGVIALGAFHKDVANEIFTRSTRTEETIDGVIYTVTNRRPENANDASLSGIEIGVSLNSFEFVHPVLRDFGFNGNYTRINSSFSIEMSNGSLRELTGLLFQPETIANATLFWAPGNFEARVAWRYSDEKLQSVSATSPTFDEYIGTEERVDMQASYRLPNGLSVFAEARNINDGAEGQLLSYGPVHWTRDYGRSFWAGVTYKY